MAKPPPQMAQVSMLWMRACSSLDECRCCKSRELPVWELRLAPRGVSLGSWGRKRGGRAAALHRRVDFPRGLFGLDPAVYAGAVWGDLGCISGGSWGDLEGMLGGFLGWS